LMRMTMAKCDAVQRQRGGSGSAVESAESSDNEGLSPANTTGAPDKVPFVYD
jgi:hypothetical protein